MGKRVKSQLILPRKPHKDQRSQNKIKKKILLKRNLQRSQKKVLLMSHRRRNNKA